MSKQVIYEEAMQKTIEKANIIVEALPYISVLAGKTVVIKYGGNAMNNPDIIKTILQDIATLKIVGVNPILVHGGGPEINTMLERLAIKSEFIGGLRVTTAETMEVVQMVLGGKVNKNIVSSLNCLGVKAIGLCGKDGKLIECKKLIGASGVDYGFVGEVTKINTELLLTLCNDQYIPVIATIGVDENGESYNINADTVASEVAVAIGAEKLIFLTDIDGIRLEEKDPTTLITEITVTQMEELIASGKISGGMIPKSKGCIEGVNRGINRVHIINGTIPHSILLEIFTVNGIGTMIKKG